MILHINEENLRTTIQSRQAPFLVAILGPFQQCHRQLILLAEFERQAGEMDVFVVRDNQPSQLKDELGVYGTPTYLLIRNEKVMKKSIGDFDASVVLEWLNSMKMEEKTDSHKTTEKKNKIIT